MTKDQLIIEALEGRARRRLERRAFLRTSGGAAAALAGVSLLSACGGGNSDDDETPTPTPTPTPNPTPQPTPPRSDQDVLNFALNLEYLEAQFYSFAVFGTGLSANLLGGAGTRGEATGGRKVNFTDPVVEQYAREIAADEIAHVRFLRQQIGSTVVAQPRIDIGTSATGAFSSAARAAGLVGAGESFDPYANDENFLLGAYVFEDVGVSAYKGAAALLSNKTFLEASAGILAAEAYHAGLIRTVLYRKGLQTPRLRTDTVRISDARDTLDGASDLDQGVVGSATTSNIVPADANGLAFSRTTGQVLNIVYLNKEAAVSGGFFPAGLNGTVKNSDDN